MSRCRWVPLLLGALLATAALAVAAGEIQLRYPTAAGSVPIKTWKDRRDEGIVKQTLDASCGSAATATILRAFYGQDISEQDILAEVIAANLAEVASDYERAIRSTLIRAALDGAMTNEELQTRLLTRILRAANNGITFTDAQGRFAKAVRDQLTATASFSDLKQAVEKFGFRAVAWSLVFEQLKRLGIPVIAYLRHRGQDHFSVVRGVSADGRVLLGDPIWGNQKFEARRFRTMWETDGEAGKVLAILPRDVDATQVVHAFFVDPKPSTALAIRRLILRNDRLLPR